MRRIVLRVTRSVTRRIRIERMELYCSACGKLLLTEEFDGQIAVESCRRCVGARGASEER